MSAPASRPPGARRIGNLAGAVADAVVAGIDLDAALAQVDVDELLARVDVNALLDRVDVDRLLDQVDVNRLLDRVDVDRLVDRADPDRLLDRVDPDRLLDRVDVERLVVRAGIADIVAQSTGQVAGTALDGVRRQVVALDVVLMRLLFGLTGRDLQRMPSGPARLVARQDDDRAPRLDAAGSPVEMSGRYSGLLTRGLALLGDVGMATGIYSLLGALVTWILAGVLSLELPGGPASGSVFFGGLVLWWLLWWVGTLALQGRTPAMALIGLRVVTRDGRPLPTRRVIAWVLTLPLSLVFGAGYVLVLLDAERRTLHDRVAGAVVVYDWGPRHRGVESPIGEFLRAQEAGELSAG